MSKPKYRWHHQKVREALLPQAWGQVCHLCGRPMLRGQLLDLDHDLLGQGYAAWHTGRATDATARSAGIGCRSNCGRGAR
jgi:hypothetical protein